jgi:hypothetical protein
MIAMAREGTGRWRSFETRRDGETRDAEMGEGEKRRRRWDETDGKRRVRWKSEDERNETARVRRDAKSGKRRRDRIGQ